MDNIVRRKIDCAKTVQKAGAIAIVQIEEWRWRMQKYKGFVVVIELSSPMQPSASVIVSISIFSFGR